MKIVSLAQGPQLAWPTYLIAPPPGFAQFSNAKPVGGRGISDFLLKFFLACPIFWYTGKINFQSERRDTGVSGFYRVRNTNFSPKPFPSSRYDNPQGGRPSALERNILKYRAYEISLFIFYAEDLKRFMIDNVYRMVPVAEEVSVYRTTEELRLYTLLRDAVAAAESNGSLSGDDAAAVKGLISKEPSDSKRLRKAFTMAVEIGLCNKTEADEIQQLIKYRNDIAHQIHQITADVSNHSLVQDISLGKFFYQGAAIDRIRERRKKISENSRVIPSFVISFDSMIFEFAERYYVEEMRKLDRLITKQVGLENLKAKEISSEISLVLSKLERGTDPRHPENFLPPSYVGDEDLYFSNKLSSKGVELCHRFFSSGVSNIAISYIMGLTLRSVQRRRKMWGLEKEGG
ncbi:MAG: hypothetical protein ABS977_02215 [Pseudomonas qingdaonensis]|uniref:hypothetical protein n=1 Tax=Pseudomonas qingdaonensis TaxID=2056231 RepID=UPI003315E929